jgi:hypothetical protein
MKTKTLNKISVITKKGRLMVNIDTKLEIDQLDSEVERLRTKTIELKSAISTFYNKHNVSNLRLNTLESKFARVVETLLDVDSIYKKHTREVRQMLTEIIYELGKDSYR